MRDMKKRGLGQKLCTGVLVLGALGLFVTVLPITTPACAQEDGGGDDEHKGPDMHALAAHPSAPTVHKDYSHYLYRPPGDRVQEQPDLDRLLFWTPDGKPDGYAQRRGSSVIYYDAAGHASRVQRLAPEDLAN